MFEIAIQLPDRPEKVGILNKGSYRIGSSPAAHIQIPHPEVSSRHALLDVRDDQVLLEDAGSTNGTFVNGERLKKTPVRVDNGAEIRIGQAVLRIRARQAGAAPAPLAATPSAGPPAKKPEPGAKSVAPPPEGATGHLATAAAPPVVRPQDRDKAKPRLLMMSGIRYEYRKICQELKRKVHTELLRRMNLKNLTMSQAQQEEIRAQAQATIHTILEEMRAEVPRSVDSAILEKELVNEAVALGPIEDLLIDTQVTEIMVNGASQVYVEKQGGLFLTDLTFADNNQVLTVIERIVAPLGRRIDESSPLVDARLPDGSRVNAIIPPLAIDGPTLTIRKFSKEAMAMESLVHDKHSLTQQMADFLRLAVLVRKNIIISGGTGTGKTTLLGAVSNFLPNDERIVTIEDAAELRLQKDHVVRLESRPPNIEGKGAIAIRDLVRNSLRMRPDRIVVGECRGGEALDMLQAMNTGHDGSLTTIHANTPRDALSRLETLVLMAGFELPLRAIREQVQSAISLVVQIGRLRDGTRKVVSITEITGMEGEVITTQDLFLFEQTGVDADGHVLGRFKATGTVPTFLEEVKAAGLPIDMSMFSEEA